MSFLAYLYFAGTQHGNLPRQGDHRQHRKIDDTEERKKQQEVSRTVPVEAVE